MKCHAQLDINGTLTMMDIYSYRRTVPDESGEVNGDQEVGRGPVNCWAFPRHLTGELLTRRVESSGRPLDTRSAGAAGSGAAGPDELPG